MPHFLAGPEIGTVVSSLNFGKLCAELLFAQGVLDRVGPKRLPPVGARHASIATKVELLMQVDHEVAIGSSPAPRGSAPAL